MSFSVSDSGPNRIESSSFFATSRTAGMMTSLRVAVCVASSALAAAWFAATCWSGVLFFDWER